MERNKPWDRKIDGRMMIRHYVIGGHPGEDAIRQSGALDQVEYYQNIIQTIRGWSGLTVEETLDAIQAAPDNIENTTDVPNYKPLYLEALQRIRDSS